MNNEAYDLLDENLKKAIEAKENKEYYFSLQLVLLCVAAISKREAPYNSMQGDKLPFTSFVYDNLVNTFSLNQCSSDMQDLAKEFSNCLYVHFRCNIVHEGRIKIKAKFIEEDRETNSPNGLHCYIGHGGYDSNGQVIKQFEFYRNWLDGLIGFCMPYTNLKKEDYNILDTSKGFGMCGGPIRT